MKLTNEKRDSIISKVVDRMFAEKEKALAQKGKDIAWEAVWGAFDHEAANSCPEGFLPETINVNVYFPGNHSFHISLDKPFKFPFSMRRWGNDGIDIPLDKLSKRTEKQISDVIYEKKNLLDAKKQAYAEVKSILYSVNTVNQLKELWPDVFGIIEIDTVEKKPLNQLAPLVSKYTKQLKAS